MPDCNCPALDSEDAEHFISCPVYEPPLTYEELRRLRATILREATH